MPAGQPWNINIHYDALLAATVAPGTQTALDVGCGDGFLSARLVDRVPDVTALDVDADVLRRAEHRFADTSIRWVHGDVMTGELPHRGFDAVLANASLHHIEDTRGALIRLAELVLPGGTLAVVTFVRPSPRNVLWHLTAWLATGVANRVRRKWDHTAAIKWTPPVTFSQLRELVRELLPGARVRRLLYGRVLITWQAPG